MPMSNLNHFLESVMHVNVLRMGGASAGIIGSAGADSDIIYNLRKCAIAFASEYHKPKSNHDELEKLSQEIGGYIQTLHVIGTLSEAEVDKLIDELQMLTDKP